MILLPPAAFWHTECENISSATSRTDFIMQNYSVKKQETIFTVCIELQEKIKNNIFA
jgi:hypothetical protein